MSPAVSFAVSSDDLCKWTVSEFTSGNRTGSPVEGLETNSRFDAEPSLPLGMGLLNDDFHVTSKRHQQTQETLHGIVLKLSPQEA